MPKSNRLIREPCCKRAKISFSCPLCYRDSRWQIKSGVRLLAGPLPVLHHTKIYVVKFYVDDIRAVKWNDEAYDHLVYPEAQKDLVLTFVENHQRTKAGLDDVIAGKGQGLISLLSGPPGTGKTLLAEAVADRTRRPLYYLHAEELGTKADLLGEKVKKVFELATEWNAVILLDGKFGRESFTS